MVEIISSETLEYTTEKFYNMQQRKGITVNTGAFIAVIALLVLMIGTIVYLIRQNNDNLNSYLLISELDKTQVLADVDSLKNVIARHPNYQEKLKERLKSNSNNYAKAKEEYIKLDTPERVKHFYKWLNDSTAIRN